MKTAIDTIREALDAAIPVSNIAYNLGQSHESRESNLKCVAKFDELRRAAITALKSLEGHGWIPVAERLPELHDMHQPGAFAQSEEVLVAFVTEDGDSEQMVDVLQRGGQGDVTAVRWCNAYNVTHWRHLPPHPNDN